MPRAKRVENNNNQTLRIVSSIVIFGKTDEVLQDSRFAFCLGEKNMRTRVLNRIH